MTNDIGRNEGREIENVGGDGLQGLEIVGWVLYPLNEVGANNLEMEMVGKGPMCGSLKRKTYLSKIFNMKCR